MKNLIPLLLLCACSTESAEPPELLSFTVNPDQALPGEELVTTVEVAHFTLTGEVDHTHDDDAGHHDEGEESSDSTGHVHIYLDDLETNPLAMQVTLEGTIVVPEEAEVGAHVLIARLHNADHLIIEPQVTLEIDLEVLAAEGR